jgi:hypothetical protein
LVIILSLRAIRGETYGMDVDIPREAAMPDGCFVDGTRARTAG